MASKTSNASEEYWKFAESERHFNNTQAGNRNLASGWMLAAFAAIALLLKSDRNVGWLVSPAVLIAVISFMSTLGLLILWINDQLVYQRLLDCGFTTALKTEYDNPRLPPIRMMMMYASKGRGMSRWMTLFYTIPMWGFLAISIVATVLRQDVGGDLDGRKSLLILTVLCVAQACTALWVQWKKSEVGSKARAALFRDKNFTSLFEGTDHARARLADAIARRKTYATHRNRLVGKIAS